MKEYKTIEKIAGPLIFVQKTEPVGYKEFVTLKLPDGSTKRGQVLETSRDHVIVQVFEDTTGIDRRTYVNFSGEIIQMPVSGDMFGRVLSGIGKPLDGGREIIPEEKRDIQGEVINPFSRKLPDEFIQTGISTIDGMNTLVRGQKLPILGIRPSPQRACAADCEAGHGQGGRGLICRGVLRHRHHAGRGKAVYQ